MENENNYISAYFEDEHDLVEAVKILRTKNILIRDVFSPFPVHGLDKALGLKRSNLPKVGFWAGALGAATGFGFQAWVFTESWPLNIGGKPFLSVPSFIPVTFEMTVLFAAIAMVFAFLIRSKLGPGSPNKIYSERITDDQFVIIIDTNKNISEQYIEQIRNELSVAGAKGIQLNPQQAN